MDPGPAHKRRRPAVACTECRRRKVRCDRASPCGPCSKSSLQCVYNNCNTQQQQQDMFAQRGYTRQLKAAVGDLDMFTPGVTYINDTDSSFLGYGLDGDIALPDLDADVLAWNSSTPSSVPSLIHASATPGLTFGPESSASGPSSVSPESGSDSSRSSPAPPARDGPWFHSLTRCRRLCFLRGVLVGLVPLVEDETLSGLMGTFARLHRAQAESKAASSQGFLGWPTNGPPPPGAGRALLPSRAVCDVLLDAYVDTFESVLRILHVPMLRCEYERFWMHPSESVDENEAFTCKLLLIVVLGAYVCLSRLLDDSISVSCIAHARQWLSSRDFSQASLNTVQIMCLLALARHAHPHAMPTGTAWFSGDHDLTRVGIQMGLHREPSTQFPDMSACEVEMRRRLWATMLELSLQVCFDEGLPAPISPESYDCEPPSLVAGNTSSVVLALLASTHRLRLCILETVNAPGACKAYEESHRLAAQLEAACRKNMDLLRAAGDATGFQTKFLDIFTRPFVLALHEPFTQATSNPAQCYFSRKMCMEISALLLAPTTGTDEACAAISTRGHGQVALVQRRAMTTLCVGLMRELEAQTFPTTDRASWRQLHETARAAVGIFEARVRVSEGMHSTHEFLVFACAEAYIQGLLGGCTWREIDGVIAEAARGALVFFCEVMGTRAIAWEVMSR